MNIPSNWKHDNNMLVREFTLGNFVEVVAFVNKIMPLAEDAMHHPDIDIYGYKNIRVKLTTHDAGATVTDKDIKLAEAINGIAD
ncbi:MAG: 4a-hydroxytetrahydrobiopterin dehydratase [Bacteroidetes bacterium]|nr:4a-hydroxytetrahydrobiopterin dehydratase [Bacteroidota bacterium]MCH8523090.1 4a-hydroxytetrahydrobiopterin dehydratase [Balneolales bacterium]